MSGLTIALTGGTGFVGRALLDELLRVGHNVVALNRRVEPRALPSHKRLSWVSQSTLEDDLMSRRFDAVVHLATVYGQGVNCSQIIETNVKLPLRLLEYACFGGCSFFINTDTFFAKPQFNYPHMLPYIQSKRDLLTWLTISASATTDLKIVNARLEHVYGFGDSQQKFVPYIFNKLVFNDSIDLTPGEQRRDFIHINDVVAAFMAIIKSAARIPAGIFEVEIGLGASDSVRDFVELARKISNSKSKINYGALKYREREIMESCANIKALVDLGWSSSVNLSDGIGLTLRQLRALDS
jgi:nucleoside-diphosphate-sugar epimerase